MCWWLHMTAQETYISVIRTTYHDLCFMFREWPCRPSLHTVYDSTLSINPFHSPGIWKFAIFQNSFDFEFANKDFHRWLLRWPVLHIFTTLLEVRHTIVNCAVYNHCIIWWREIAHKLLTCEFKLQIICFDYDPIHMVSQFLLLSFCGSNGYRINFLFYTILVLKRWLPVNIWRLWRDSWVIFIADHHLHTVTNYLWLDESISII